MEHIGAVGRRIYLMRRVLATLCVAVVAILIGYKAIFGPNGMVVWRIKKAEYQTLQREIDRANVEHQQLEKRVTDLQSNPQAIRKEAREKLGYVMPTDTVLVEPQPKRDPRAASAVAENVLAPSPAKQ